MKITKNVFAGVLFVVAIYSFGALAEGFDSKPSSSNDSEVIPSLSVVGILGRRHYRLAK